MKKLSLKLVICISVCLATGISSGVSTIASVNNWYRYIEKPAWNPPDNLFAPVWTVLYILMGVALALVWHTVHPLKKKAITLFVIQFLLNITWSYIFFTLHDILWAFVHIIFLLLMITVTMITFYKVRKTAAHLLIPYICWVAFATVLNGTIWFLNK